MEREQTTIQIGLRINESTNLKIERKASEIGVSKNALILMLIDLGFKFCDSSITVALREE